MKDFYILKNIKKIKWGVLEENQPIHLYPIMYPGWNGVIRASGKFLGRYQKNIACLFRGDNEIIFVDHEEWTVLGQLALKKVVNNPYWGLKLNRQILKAADELERFTKTKIFKTDLSKVSNTKLYQLYQEYLKKQDRVYSISLIPVYLDLYKPHLTTYLVEYLEKQRQKVKGQRTAKEYFALLTVPENLSKVQSEEIDLLKIAKQVKQRKLSKKSLPSNIVIQFERHCDKYRYMGYNWEGPAFTDDYFWKRLKEMIEDSISPKQKITRTLNEKKQSQKIYKQLVRALKVDHKHQKLLDVTRGFIYSKDYRKMSLVRSYYEVEVLLKEIAKRLNLNLSETRSCLLDEIDLIFKGKLDRPKDLPKRMKGCLFVIIDGDLPGKIFIKQDFEKMKKLLLKKKNLTEVNYFHGQTACLGKARGTVKIINSVDDLKKMRKGDIMVSQMTNPNLVPAMKRAAAVITDSGGVTCHAAIVSRELKIPCIIGTKIATKVLKDGDKVVVDANQGEVRRI